MRHLSMHPLAAPLAAGLVLLAGTTSAQTVRNFNDSFEPNDSNWSNSGNWNAGNIADTNSERADIVLGDPVIDADFTVNELRTTFGNPGSLFSGVGTLTIDKNVTTATLALVNGTGNSGSVMAFDGNLTINNSNATPGRTVARNNNSDNNIIRFNPTSVLTLQTGLELQVGSATVRGAYEFNGVLAGPSDLFFNRTLATFGDTADNAGYEGDLVFFADALTVSNVVGGTLVKSGSKVQVNGSGSRIEVNGAETFLGSVVLGGTNAFTLDVNANQSAMELLEIADGQLTLDVDAAVTELAFADSSAVIWGAGTVNIVGFKEDTIRFGSSASGITPAQLAAIDGGIYSINSQGYLTTMIAPSLFGDYNQDGKVDAADYTVWRDNQNGNQPLPNDNGLGTPIGAAHYSLWASNYGDSAPSATAIPEPGALLLTVGALGVGCGGARRNSRRTPSDTQPSGVGAAF